MVDKLRHRPLAFIFFLLDFLVMVLTVDSSDFDLLRQIKDRGHVHNTNIPQKKTKKKRERKKKVEKEANRLFSSASHQEKCHIKFSAIRPSVAGQIHQ